MGTSIPSIQLLQSRLAGRAHLRQASVIVAAQDLAGYIAGRYRRLARELAERVAHLGLAGIAQSRQEIDDAFTVAQYELAQRLLELGTWAYESAADMIIDSLPLDWLGVFSALAAERVPEAAESAPRLPGLKVTYQWDLGKRGALSADEARNYVRDMLFPPPDSDTVLHWLSEAPPGGQGWQARLRRWAQPTRDAMLSQTVQGYVEGENVDGLRKRLQPLADGIAYKAQRIARTEGCRVAERASRACSEQMGDMLGGLQIVAVMDQWTRSHHALRHGKVYDRDAEGAYKDKEGNVLPDLPDEPNCRCTTIPVVHIPDTLLRNPELLQQFETATDKLIPDPSSYIDWWHNASERQRMTAVGVKRYKAMVERRARERLTGSPDWAEFLAPDGKLLSVEQIRSESIPDQWERKAKLVDVIYDRKWTYRDVSRRGFQIPHTLPPPPPPTLPLAFPPPSPPPPIAISPTEQLPEMPALLKKLPRVVKQVGLSSEWLGHLAVQLHRYESHLVFTADELAKQKKYNRVRTHTFEEKCNEIRRRREYAEQRMKEAPQVTVPLELGLAVKEAIRQREKKLRKHWIKEAIGKEREVLYLPREERSKWSVRFSADMNERTRETGRRMVEFMSRVVSRKLVGHRKLKACIDKTLAPNSGYYRKGVGIYVGQNALPHIFVHEFTHDADEAAPDFMRAGLKWRSEKTKGGKLVLGGTYKGRDWYYLERTDGVPQETFLERYMMRVYDGDYAHEVHSVGLERLYLSPSTLLMKDPSHFELIVKGVQP